MNKLVTAMILVGFLLAPLPGQASSEKSSWATRGWAGYVVRAGNSSFDEVTASWTQPRVVCNRPGSSAARWIGLGGTRSGSKSLEQIGTSADCSERAVLSYSA
jgi:hypothetical protein